MRAMLTGLLLGALLLPIGAAARSTREVDGDGDFVAEAVHRWVREGRPQALQFREKDGKYSKAIISEESLESSSLTYSDSAVTFHLYTKNNVSDIQGTIVSFNKSNISAAGWNVSWPTRIVVHGFDDSIVDPVIQLTKNGYLSVGSYNVIGVDWSSLCAAPWYIQAVLNVHPVGRRVGEFITYLLDNDLTTDAEVHVIGHSLGAHVAGIGSEYATTGDRRIARTTGLDPAQPLFEWASSKEIISTGDARLVDIIHTTCILGFAKSLGDVDFYPNGGKTQPGCGLDWLWLCAHDKSYHYFAESIIDGGFPSQYCSTLADAQKGDCNATFTGSMGADVKFSKTGKYFLRTADSFPFNLAARSRENKAQADQE